MTQLVFWYFTHEHGKWNSFKLNKKYIHISEQIGIQEAWHSMTDKYIGNSVILPTLTSQYYQIRNTNTNRPFSIILEYRILYKVTNISCINQYMYFYILKHPNPWDSNPNVKFVKCLLVYHKININRNAFFKINKLIPFWIWGNHQRI